MTDILSRGGVKQVVLLPMESDRVPVTVQLLDVVTVESTSQSSRIEVVISDGSHSFQMTLAKRLYELVHRGELRRGVIVSLQNYIIQSLFDGKMVLICLDLSIVGFDDAIIGSPSEFIPPSVVSSQQIEFVGVTIEGACSHCEQMPCEWMVYGPTIVQSVRASHGSSPNIDRHLTNKTCRHAAYTTYTRTKFGYLGRGKRVPLPTCVVNGIRDNFLDANNNYVGFVPTADD